MIKESIQEEDTRIENICAPDIGAPQYIKQTLTDKKGETDRNTIIVGDFKTPLTAVERSSKQKTSKETQVLNDTLDAAAAKSLQSCPTLCDPIDGSPPGSPIPGILQARILEWVAISFSNA